MYLANIYSGDRVDYLSLQHKETSLQQQNETLNSLAVWSEVKWELPHEPKTQYYY